MSGGASPEEERDRWRPLQGQVRALLWREWDPIGVRDLDDAPEDEYDSYVLPVVGMILRSDEPEQIARYLTQIETTMMGLGPVVWRARLNLARKLAALAQTL